MSHKHPITFRTHPLLAERFLEAAKPFYGKLGVCFGAALLMFLESDPEVQGAFAKKVFALDVDDDVRDAIDAAKAEQLRRIKDREERGTTRRRGKP